MLKNKIHFISLIIIVFTSCNRGMVSIKDDTLSISGGVSDGIIISKLKNISSMENYPINFDIDTTIVLKMDYFKSEFSFKNNTTEYFNKEGVIIKLREEIPLYERVKGYYWMIKTDVFEVFPLKFQNNSWYEIQGIEIYGEEFYMYFYVNEEGKIKEFLRKVSYSPV
ncbi:hypothetical protein [Tenacibaculum maritimum]|uniref:hypothetical protein n=1 Tax=Tenacibaculum maritimum TaxID=107401 RepID=UPI001E44C33E|nr:hypothetical protein [Tenacibaculum maritimum]MCD9612166.1 hypothetical protein [Tenacibaculum maritimum]